METTCPPIPTLQQFAELYHTGEYILVDVEDLQRGEYVLSTHPNWNYLICIQIGENNEQHLQFRFQHQINDDFINERKAYINSVRGTNREFLFFRKNFRKNFDDITKKMGVRIRNYPKEHELTSAETIFANKGLSDNIGKFLGPPTSGKGGRRKRRGTKRRTRKNKRKSTRRIGRKYKR
jgi:hypothetical protein